MLKKIFHIGPAEGEEPAQPVLAIRIGERHCGVAITDRSGNELHSLDYYTIDESETNPLSAIFNDRPELDKAFYKVMVSYDHPQSTLVPLQQYQYENSSPLLKSLYGVNGLSAIVSESIPEWQVYNVYAVPKDLQEWVSRKFAAGTYWHQYTIAIRHLGAADTTGRLLVDFRTDDFTVIAASGSKLLLAQNFTYTTPEDVLYYLLKICQEFGLSQQEVQLSLSGLIDKQSALYKDLYQYFIHIEFREAGWNIPSGEYPAHFFTSLNDLARCAS